MALYRDPYAELADEYLNRGAPAAPATPARAATPVEPTQEEIDASRRRSALRRTSESEKALNTGLSGLESAGYAVRGLARIGLNDEAGGIRDIQRMEEINQRAAAEGPRVQNLDQIEGVGDAFEYARNLGLGQVPNIALTAATGGVGGVARGVGSSLARTGAQSVLRTRLARELATEAGETVVSRATQREAARRAAQQFASKEAAPLFSQTGAKVGAAVGGSALQAGQTAGAVLDEESTDTVGVRAAKAATGAALTGSLEALPVMALFRRYGLTGATEAAEKAVTGNVLARVAKQGAKQGAAESATELAQTVGEVATHKWVNDNVDLLGDEALNQYVNAAVGGAVGGAIFGAPAGIRGNRDEAARTRIRDGLTQGWNSVSEKMRRTVTPAPAAAPVSEPVETKPTGDVASRVAAKVETLRQTFEQDVKPRLEAGASDIQKQFTELLERFKKDDEANSLLAEFDAEPFDFTDVNGEAVFTGTPMASFANRDLLGDVKQAGLKGMSAQLAAALPTLDDALRLSSNGGLDAPVRAFRGEDVGKFSEQELDSLFSYMRALPEDKANKFRRFLATQEVLRERGFLQSEDAQVTTPAPAFTERAARVGDAAAARSMSEANNTVARVDRELQRAVRGAPISGQRGLDNRWWTQPDEKGVRREVNLATALKALDQDKDFQEETKTFSAHDRQVAKLARIVQAAADAGTPIDPQSIRSVPLNKSGSQVIPEAVADALRRGLTPQAAPDFSGTPLARAAAGRRPVSLTENQMARDRFNQTRARAIDDNRGQADRMDVVEEVQDPDAGLGSDALRLVPIRDGSGSPSGTQDTQYALPRNPEAQIDREAQNTQYFTEKGDPLPMEREPRVNPRVRLDTLLERYAGRKPENKVEDRRALLAQALRRKDLPASQLRELRDAADAYAEDRYARVVERNNKALAAWQKNKNPQTKRELNKARAALNMARADMAARQKRAEAKKPAVPVTVPRGPGKRNLERRRKTVEGKKARVKAALSKSAEANLPADGGPQTSKTEPRTRSRRQLYQEAQEWINKTGVSETRRLEELIRIEGELKTLGQHMDTAIRNEVLAQRRQRVTPAKTFNAVRDALMSESVATAEDALRAVRELASPEQRRLIDTLLQMDGVKNTSFTLEFNEKFPPGALNATYYSTKHASLDGRITLRFPMLEATSDTAADPLHTLLHEAIHAMTSYAEQTNPAVSAALSRLLNHARAQAKAQGVDPDGWYGLSETQEFIAEAFTNPEFKKLLESMPAANTDLFKNLWEQFKDFVAKLLGIKGAEATALDEAITIGLEAGRLKQVARVEAVRAMLRGESAFNLPGNEGEPINYMLTLPPQARIKLAAAFAPPLLGKTDKASAWNRIRELAPTDLKPLLDTSDRGIALAMNLGIAYALDGRLDLAKQHRTPVGQMWDAISKTLQIPSANVYAQQIIKDLKDKNVGNGYDPVKRTVSSKLARNITKFAERKVRPVADALLKNIDTRIREQGIPAMTEMATLLSQRTGEFRADKERSFRQRVQEQQAQWLEKLGTVITGISPQDQVVLIRALQSQKGLPPKHKDLQPVFDGLRKWLDEFHRYSTDAGVKMGQIENYFPVAMDADEVARRREQFFELHRAPNFEQPIRERFKKWVRAEIDTVRQRAGSTPTRAETVRIERLEGRLNQFDKAPIDELIGDLYEMAIYGGREHYIAGVNFTDEAHKPAFSSAKPRTSDFIFTHGTPEQKAAFSKFQDNNLSRVLITYANRGVRRAEWERMGMTERLSSLKLQAKVEGATGKQMQMFDDYVNQIMGTYNDNWNPLIYRGMQAVDRVFDTKVAETDFQKFKQAQSAILTYNNVRLLPLALVSSLVDPLATVVRSGSPAGALSNFTDAVRAFRDKSNDDQLRQMAEDLGVIERQGIQEALAYMYGNVYDPNSRAAKINSMLFRFNGLEAMTRFTRLMALQSGHRFLIRHAKGEGDSARYLSELGLEPSDIKVAENGRFVELNEKTQAALRRFVEESVVRPHAGQRPSWHNDPNFALAAQYKGYLYAFYETVLKRVGVELANGNPAVLAPLVLYLPMTAMAEAARDIAQGDDEDKDFDHYAKLSLERSGLLGARHGVLADAGDNVKFGNGVLGNLAGPTGQQLGDAYDVLTGDGSAGNLAVEALPGQALYKNWGE